MSVTLGSTSRLRFGELLSVSGIEFWSVLDLPVIPNNADDLTYTVLTGDRIDQLAYQHYGDPVLWWVIARANDLELLPTELYAGQKLRIPSPTYVSQVLFTKATT